MLCCVFILVGTDSPYQNKHTTKDWFAHDFQHNSLARHLGNLSASEVNLKKMGTSITLLITTGSGSQNINTPRQLQGLL